VTGRGIRVGIDVGTVRIGVARSDVDGLLATPVETVHRGAGDLERISAIAVDADAVEIVVGLPIGLSGADTASTRDARSFAERLATVQELPVRMVDERLSTVSANSAMRDVGRTAKRSRHVIDQVAAVIILQHALDHERAAGSPPGEIVEPMKDVRP
jgi:putative holliday junction resolvase